MKNVIQNLEIPTSPTLLLPLPGTPRPSGRLATDPPITQTQAPDFQHFAELAGWVDSELGCVSECVFWS